MNRTYGVVSSVPNLVVICELVTCKINDESFKKSGIHIRMIRWQMWSRFVSRLFHPWSPVDWRPSCRRVLDDRLSSLTRVDHNHPQRREQRNCRPWLLLSTFRLQPTFLQPQGCNTSVLSHHLEVLFSREGAARPFCLPLCNVRKSC